MAKKKTAIKVNKKVVMVPVERLSKKEFRELSALAEDTRAQVPKLTPACKNDKRAQITFRGIGKGWVVCLRIEPSLHSKLLLYCRNRNLTIGEALERIFEDGLVSEEAIQSYLSNLSVI
jgi:hypothetical protein